MSDGDRMRLDLWLWRARFFKSRSLAAAAIEAGGVRVQRDGQVRRIEKASATCAAGDLLSFSTARGVVVVRVVALPDRRGPPAEAALCHAPADLNTPLN
jgi:ribosome-associated heat shock protein Hsp15